MATNTKPRTGNLILVLLLVSVVAVTGCVISQGAELDSRQSSEVIILLEYGKVFLVNPQGGNAYPVPYDGQIFSVRASTKARTLLVKVKNERHQPMYKEIALDGTILGLYSDPPQGHGFTVNANDEPLAGRDAYSPDGKQRVFWKKKPEEPDPTWQLIVEQFAEGATPFSEHVLTTRVLKKFGFVGGIQWSPDGQWIAWAETKDRGWGLGREPFARHFKIRADGTGLEEIKIYRPMSQRVLRELWPSEPHGYQMDFQWVRFSSAVGSS